MPFIAARRWESGVWTVAPMCTPVSGASTYKSFSPLGAACVAQAIQSV